jgi:glutathione S-transferase
MRLVTIPFSHYCEKARWGLQHARLPFVEQGHAPLFHRRAVRAAGGGRTVPVLVTDDQVLPDSTDILRFADRWATADRKLYPAPVEDEVAALEDLFDEQLGPHTRRLAYYYTLPDRALVVGLGTRDVPRWQARLVDWGFPLARAYIKRGFKIDEAGAARSLKKVDDVFRQVDGRLADGRPYLTGDRFTAADLTFAALGALLFPPQHPIGIPEDRASPAYLALRDQLKARPAGALLLRLYRDWRSRPA